MQTGVFVPYAFFARQLCFSFFIIMGDPCEYDVSGKLMRIFCPLFLRMAPAAALSHFSVSVPQQQQEVRTMVWE